MLPFETSTRLPPSPCKILYTRGINVYISRYADQAGVGSVCGIGDRDRFTRVESRQTDCETLRCSVNRQLSSSFIDVRRSNYATTFSHRVSLYYVLTWASWSSRFSCIRYDTNNREMQSWLSDTRMWLFEAEPTSVIPTYMFNYTFVFCLLSFISKSEHKSYAILLRTLLTHYHFSFIYYFVHLCYLDNYVMYVIAYLCPSQNSSDPHTRLCLRSCTWVSRGSSSRSEII